MSPIPTAFVLMPFAAEFDDIYEYLIKGALEEAGFNVTRADDIRNQRNILADIVQAITNANLIIADISTANPNVYYELGLAHAFRKHVILLAQNIDEVPFDLQSYRILTYSIHFSRMNEARNELYGLAKGVLNGTVLFGSPVSDFTTLSGDEAVKLNTARQEVEKHDDRGLLDYQTEVEEGFAVISSVIEDVGKRLNVLTPEITTTTEQFQSNSDTSKRRSIVRALAVSLDDYAKWLHQGNMRYRQTLGRISESLNALLSGEFKIEENDISGLQVFMSVMASVEQQAQNGQKHISELVITIDNLPRIEKEFNLAKRSLSDELKELIGNIDQTVAVLARARNAAARFLGE